MNVSVRTGSLYEVEKVKRVAKAVRDGVKLNSELRHVEAVFAYGRYP